MNVFEDRLKTFGKRNRTGKDIKKKQYAYSGERGQYRKQINMDDIERYTDPRFPRYHSKHKARGAYRKLIRSDNFNENYIGPSIKPKTVCFCSCCDASKPRVFK